MNLATLVTALRIALSPLFFILFTTGVKNGIASIPVAIALWLIFAIMETTDFLDGYVARRMASVTELGKVFDPFADSLARLTYFLSFVVAGFMPGWIFLLVMYRDLAVSFIRLLAMKKGMVMSAQLSGKVKAWIYAIAGGMGLFQVTIASLGFDSFLGLVVISTQACFWVCAATAVWTFLDYAGAYRRLDSKE